jgi:tetraacyldisaccharide 4'-kinase
VRRAALAAASAFLDAATRLRRVLHGAGLLPTAVLPAPVVSVGNLAAGGAGKTPLVEHLVGELRALGARPVVLSRGYGGPAGAGGLNDEGLVLAENLPGLPQRQSPDRASAGRAALAAGEGDCLLLDDGFQHFRVARDLDVVALDAGDPFGGGLRRERPGALRRAGLAVLTRAGRAGPERTAASRRAVEATAPGLPVAVADHEPSSLVPLGGGPERPPSALRGRRVFACAGIADPASFAATLESLGAVVAGTAWFPDHGLRDLARMGAALDRARRAGADLVVVTQKDAVKIAAAGGGPPPLPVASLRVRIRVLEGEGAIRDALRAALDRGRARAGGAR